MKKLGLLFVFLIAFSTQFFAQDEAPKVRIGLIATPGLSWLKSNKNGLSGEGTQFAFAYGLHAEFKITKNIYFTTGLTQSNFSGKVSFKDSVLLTYKVTENGNTTTNSALLSERTYNFNSIELPIKLKLKTPEIGYFTYFVELGVNSNIIYKATAKENKVYIGGSTTAVELTDDQAKLDANEETNWYRFGSLINVGFEYNFIGNTSLLVSANWSRSFSSILKDQPDNLMYPSNLKAFAQSGNLDYASLTVGIIF